MRDLETIELALSAAETGHLVFGTLHTSSAAKTVDRIVDVFPAAEKEMVRAMMSESLRAVISQTLLKKIGGGRIAAHEIMIGTPAIRNLIRENKIAQMYSAIQTGQGIGMQTLDQNLEQLLQKGLIGKCPFEKNKQRCSTSHPLFEEYRMLCFVNNVKIKTPSDEKLRFLNQEERDKIQPLFYRKSKEHFDFEDIAKHLAPKKQYKFYKAREEYPEDYLFNYSMKTTVSGCPVSARFESIFGENWKELNIKHIRKADNKESSISIYDV